MTKFYYKVLGISEKATDQQIKDAYKQLAKKWHPDKNLDNKKRADQMFNIISEAYQILSNKKSRKLYDQNININNNIQDPFDIFEKVFQKTRLRPFNRNNDEMVLFNPFNRLINDSNSYFTSSSTVKRSYIKDGQRIVEEKHIYTDKDGKLKEDKKVRKTPVNMKYRIENR
jgi:curved DNA-binding protein